jgi:hypothetical protein
MTRFVKLAIACFAAALLTILSVALASVGTRTNGNASVHLPKRLADLGRVTLQEKREVRFLVMNQGNCRLVINELDGGCRCGTPIQKTVCVPPGKSAVVIASIDTRFVTGAIEKTTTFTTNDPTQPRFELVVKASVQPAEL